MGRDVKQFLILQFRKGQGPLKGQKKPKLWYMLKLQ